MTNAQTPHSAEKIAQFAHPDAHDLELRDRYRAEWAERTTTAGDEALLDAVFGNSPYLSKSAIKYPACVQQFIDLGANDSWNSFLENFALGVAETGTNLQNLERLLRQSKDQAALLIALADLSGQWAPYQVMARLSEFADLCVATALASLLTSEHDKGNIELPDINTPFKGCGLFILALGKLGSRELNYSSDIDLMVLFDVEVLPYRGSKSPQEFAVKLTKNLIRLLDDRTVDGYVFRTDLRLRPDPSSTSVAVSVEAAEVYYESWGQNWERSALIKARNIAGDDTIAAQFLKNLEPFIWRKSLDFYAIQDIHAIKRQIYAAKGGSTIDVLGHDIKTGRGGIREIEFFVQIQQLIWGGRTPDLRIPGTLDGLIALHTLGFVEEHVVTELRQSYIFLRMVEHRLQMINDEQTQKIPNDPDKATAVAIFCGFDTLADFNEAVTHHLRQVESHYADLFEDAPELNLDGNLVFTGTDHDPDTLQTLSRLGFANPEAVSKIVRDWHHGRSRATRSTRARQLLTELLPNIVSAFGKTNQPDRAFLKFDQFLQSLPAGVQLFSVFYANPDVLGLVADIMGDAPRLADYLTASTQRLDYVLDPEFFSDLAAEATLTEELRAELARAPDFETKLDASRRWTNDLRFRIGVQVLRNLLTPDAGALDLSVVADITIRALVPEVCGEFEEKFGTIAGGDLAILAYGKLGSKELTPTSDLDLVVIYDCDGELMSEGGPKSLPASSYYARLTQRIMSALTVLTAEGRLYEVDMRLRPSGDQGPLASRLDAFEKYQTEDAWIWEHLALTKARPVFATGELGNKLTRILANILAKPKPADEIAKAILEMRERIQAQYGDVGPWDMKHRSGGLMEAEFILQYHALLHFGAVAEAKAVTASEVIDALESAGVIEDALALKEAISLYTNALWLRRLMLEPSAPADDIPLGLERRLLTVTGLTSRGELEEKIGAASEAISALFKKSIG